MVVSSPTSPVHGTSGTQGTPPADTRRPEFLEALLYWLRLGFISFGGPAGQIAIMQTELVERRRWIAHQPFMAGLNFSMLLPGPEAQQLATYIGWRLHGLKGALAAGILFVLPGALVLAVLSWIAAAYGKSPWVAALFDGFRPAVVAIIAAALWRLSRRSMTRWAPAALAMTAFLALTILHLPFPAVVATALAVGAASARFWPGMFSGGHGHAAEGGLPAATAPTRSGSLRLALLVAVFAGMWVVPVFAVVLVFGADPWQGIAALFTKAAFVTFGGAYAVLPYVAAEAVEHYQWLDSAQMIDGLALAETTPGPLILVTQWIGWFAGYNNPGMLPPVTAGLLGAALTTYVTFLPCFLFILAGAPYVERVARNVYAAGALGAVSAAVVGVIASLGVYIGHAALLPGGVPDPFAIALALVALILLLATRIGIPWIVVAGGLAGLAGRSVGLTG